LIYFILGMIFESFCNLLVEPIRNKWRKECNYHCSMCKVWDCPVHMCRKKKTRYFEKTDQK